MEQLQNILDSLELCKFLEELLYKELLALLSKSNKIQTVGFSSNIKE